MSLGRLILRGLAREKAFLDLRRAGQDEAFIASSRAVRDSEPLHSDPHSISRFLQFFAMLLIGLRSWVYGKIMRLLPRRGELFVLKRDIEMQVLITTSLCWMLGTFG